jgi:dTDP-glucose pyrophosphorylase
MNILIPMAGAGQRFQDAGFDVPKPYIPIEGTPMIQWVVENLLEQQIHGTYIFLIQEEHLRFDAEKTIINMFKNTPSSCYIITVPGLTAGQLCTALYAREMINTDEQLLIVNSDNYFIWNENTTLTSFDEDVSGAILTFNDSEKNTHWSFAKITEENVVTRIEEKNPISDDALAGGFMWKHGSDFIKYADCIIAKEEKVRGEYYIAPVMNEAIVDGSKIINCKLDNMVSMGTPEELKAFTHWVINKRGSHNDN